MTYRFSHEIPIHISIFIVFFNLLKGNTLRTKIAQYIKLPYVTDNADIFNTIHRGYEKTDFRYYNRTYNTMYYIKSLDSVTYFRPTSNLVTYERKVGDEVPVFIPDFLNTSYNLVQFNKLNIINKSENNLLVKTAKDKLYFVSLDIQWHDNKRYIAFIDIKSGKPLLMINKNNEQLSGLLPTLNRHVIPIFQAKEQSIFIHLIDLSSDKVATISWNLMNIKQLIIYLLRLGKVPISQKNEIMEDEIKYFYVDKDIYIVKPEYDVRYENSTNVVKYVYVKSVTVRVKLIVYGEKFWYSLDRLSIKVEIDNEKIVCYWDLTDIILTVHKKVYHYREVTYDFYLRVQDVELTNNVRMLQRSHNLREQKGYKYISTDLYENDCYHIQQNNKGIMIKEKSLTQYGQYYKSSLYRYGKYLIIIQDHVYSKMVFIDTQKNLVYKFVIYPDQYPCPRYRFTYHYYPLYKSNKLFFLSKDLQCLMIVDMNKVEHFISSDDAQKCKALDSTDIREKYASIEDVSIIFDVKEMIIKAIYNKQKLSVEPDSIIILGHQVDKNAELLYVIAKYTIQNIENIGVFVLNMSSNLLQFELSSFAIRHPQNPALRILNEKKKYFKFISNLDLYKTNFGGVNISNIDIYYNNDNAFASIKYNRVSYPVMKGQYEKDKLIVESIDNLIIMKYDCKYTDDIKEMGREYAESGCSSSYALLTCDLALVQKMPAVLM